MRPPPRPATDRAAAAARRRRAGARPPGPGRRGAEGGSTLAVLMVMVAVMSILLTVAAQQWSFLTRRELERELAFRGERLLLALSEYQARVGGAPPTSLDDLTKQPRPVLPRVWPDPMTARYDRNGDLVEGTGEWQIIGVGDPAAGAASPTTQRRGLRDRRRSGPATPAISGLRGIHSASEELSIGAWRDLPPGTPYNEWRFEVQFGRTDTGTAGGREARLDDRPPGFGGLRAPGGPPVQSPLMGGQQQPGAQQGGRSGGQQGGRSGGQQGGPRPRR